MAPRRSDQGQRRCRDRGCSGPVHVPLDHAHRADHHHAEAAPAAPKTAPKPAAKPANTTPAVSGNTVTVKAGDTLSELAAKLGVKGGWQALYAANPNLVKNPNLIYVGQVLRLPARPGRSPVRAQVGWRPVSGRRGATGSAPVL